MARAARLYPRKAEIERVVQAAKSLGLDVTGLRVFPDGRIEVIDRRTVSVAPTNDFDRWESLL